MFRQSVRPLWSVCALLIMLVVFFPTWTLADTPAELIPIFRDFTLPPDLTKDVNEFLAQGRADLALKRLLRDEQRYSGNGDFDYCLGVVALEAGAYTQALYALERVTLLYPDRAGAWIDLAVVHARLGETDTAALLIEHVEKTFNPPNELRNALDNARLQLIKAQVGKGWRGELFLLMGHDSNANAGLLQQRLSLTSGTGLVTLDIDPSFRPRGDSFLQTNGQVERSWTTGLANGDGRFLVNFNGYFRQYTRETNFNLGSIGAIGKYQQPLAGGDIGVAFGTQYATLGGEPLLQLYLAQMSWEKSLHNPWLAFASNCRAGATLEQEWRTYTGRDYLNGDTTWVGGLVSCTQEMQNSSLSFRQGNDTPTEVRPGGRTRRREILLRHQRPAIGQSRIELSISYAEQQDAEGYSPLLENDTHRWVGRTFGRLMVSWPLGNNFEGIATVEYSRQSSNLSLFEQRDTTGYMGLRYRF